MPRRTIHLLPDLDGFLDRMIATGRYADASDVVSEALSLLEDREVALDALRAKLKAQIAEGLADLKAGRTHDIDDVFAEVDDIIRQHEARRDAAE